MPSFPTPGSSPPSSANRNSSPRGSPNTNANSSSQSNPNRSFPRPDLDPNHPQRPQEAPYSTYTPRSAPNAPRSRTTSAPMNPRMTPPTGGQPDIPRPTSSAGRQPAPRSSDTAHVSSPPPFPPPPMSTLVTLPRSFLSGLSVSALKQILFESRVRVPPGVVEKEELVERVWALVEEEKRKDDEGLDDIGFDTREDEMEDMESPDWTEEADHHHANADGVEHGHVQGDSEISHEERSSVPAMDSDLRPSRPTTPHPSTSPPKPPTSPSHPSPRSKPRPHSQPTTAERSGLCVVCQDEEACIAIVDCGYVIHVLFCSISRPTCLFVATSPCVAHALILFSRVLENALYVARGLSRRLDYLGYLRRKLTCVDRSILIVLSTTTCSCSCFRDVPLYACTGRRSGFGPVVWLCRM